MSNYKYDYTEDQVAFTATQGLEICLEALVSEGLLDSKIAHKFLVTHAIVMATKENQFSKSWERSVFWEKMNEKDFKEDGSPRLICVKVMGPEFDGDEDELPSEAK